MTLVGALYDIHGNLPALEATLAAGDAAGVERWVVGGDVLLGPMPLECLARLDAEPRPIDWVRGNCDRLVVEAFDGGALAALPPAVAETVRWVAARIPRAVRDRLAGWPLTVSLAVPGLGQVLFCHGTPRRDDEILTVRSAEADLRAALAGVAEPLVVCGHTHMQYDRTVPPHRVVNAGSVGMPFGAPGAHWLLLGPGLRPQRTPYDAHAAAAMIAATAYPGAAGFAERQVLHPPSEADALARFHPAAT